MNDVSKLDWRDWIAAIGLFAASVALRVPFRSQMAYLWDSAEFSLAVRDYNVALSQPHAPGYFLYVMIGRLVNWFLGDPHASLVWMSVFAGSGLVAVMYLLGTTMFGRRTGAAVGLFAMTSPQVWFHSCVALTYAVDALLVSVMILWCWRAMQRGRNWAEAVGIGILLAIIGGVRQQTLPALVPLLIYVFWSFKGQRLGKFTVALVIAIVLCVGWMQWMVQMSGGWRSYRQALDHIVELQSRKMVVGGGWDALGWNLFFTALFCWNGLILGVLLLAGALIYRIFGAELTSKREWDHRNRTAIHILWLWILPTMLLGTLVGYTESPGHIFTYLPGWLLIGAVIAAQLQKRATCVATVTAVCAVNIFAFTAWPKKWDYVFFGNGRTAREIREHDQELGRMVSAIRGQLNPKETLICHAREYLPLGLRHLQLYLPEFDQFQLAIDPAMLTPAGRPMMKVIAGRLEFACGIELGEKRVLALIVPRGTSLQDYVSYFDVREAKPLPGSENTVFALPINAAK